MKKGVLVCFFGIDGSGKTTLAKSLIEDLKTNKIESKYLWWLEAENSIFRRFLRFIFPNTEKNKEIDNTKVLKIFKKFPLLSLTYQYLVIFDHLIQAIFKIRIPLILGKNIICDRYIYDVIISFSIEFEYSKNKFKNILNNFYNLFPKPNLAFLIDIPEEIALKRKDDSPSINHLKTERVIYTDLAKKYRMIILDGSKDLTKLKSKILNKVLKFLKKK